MIRRSPETGFGYIKSEKPLNLQNIKGIKISKFIEKPNLDEAKELIKDRRFTWNSGIFLFKAKTIINEIKFFFLKHFALELPSLRSHKQKNS